METTNIRVAMSVSAARCVVCNIKCDAVRMMFLLGKRAPLQVCAHKENDLCEWRFPRPYLLNPLARERDDFELRKMLKEEEKREKREKRKED